MNGGERRFAGKTGSDYDLFRLSCPYYDEVEDELKKIIKRTYKSSKLETIKVLEVGTGSGYTSKHLLFADPRVVLTSVDDEPVMHAMAKENLHEFIMAGRLKLEVEDALSYVKSLPPRSYDAFASAFTLHNFERSYRHEFLKEIPRILRGNGIFANADKYARDGPEHKNDLAWQLDQFGVFDSIGRPDLRTVWTEHYIEDDKPERRMEENESVAELRKLGFGEITVSCRRYMEAVVFARKR